MRIHKTFLGLQSLHKERRLIFEKAPEKKQPDNAAEQSDNLSRKEQIMKSLRENGTIESITESIKEFTKDNLFDMQDVQGVVTKMKDALTPHLTDAEKQKLQNVLPQAAQDIYEFFKNALGVIAGGDSESFEQHATEVKNARVNNTSFAPLTAPGPTSTPAGAPPLVAPQPTETQETGPRQSNALVQNYLDAKEQHEVIWQQRREISSQYRRLRGRNRYMARNEYRAEMRRLHTREVSSQINAANREFEHRYGMNITEFSLMLVGYNFRNPPGGDFEAAKASLSPDLLNVLSQRGKELTKKFRQDQIRAEAMDAAYRKDSYAYRSNFAKQSEGYGSGKESALVLWNKLGRGPLANQYFERRRLRRQLGIPEKGYRSQTEIRFDLHKAQAGAEGKYVHTRGSSYAVITKMDSPLGRFLRGEKDLTPAPKPKKDYWESRGLSPAIKGLPLSTLDTKNGTVYLGRDKFGKGAMERQVVERDLQKKSIGSLRRFERSGQAFVRIPELDSKVYSTGQLVFLKVPARTGGVNIYTGQLRERQKDGTYRIQMDSSRIQFAPGTNATVHLPEGGALAVLGDMKQAKEVAQTKPYDSEGSVENL